jgi:ATP-binding cassette subfamily B protein
VSGSPAPGPQDEEVLGKAYDARLIRRLWQWIRPHRGLLALSFAMLVLASAVELVQPYLIKLAIDRYITERRTEGLAGLALAFLAALAAQLGLHFVQLFLLERTGQNVVFDMRTEVFAHLQRLPASFFDRHPVGRLMTRVTSDVEAIHEAFTSGLVVILADALKLVGIVAILLWMDWRLALVTFALLPPTLAATWHVRGRVRVAYRHVRAMVARLNAFLQESVSGMQLVQLFVRERANLEAFQGINREHRDAQLSGVRYDSVFSAVVELLGSLSLAAIVWAGGGRILRGSVSFGTLVAFIEYAERFFRPVQELSQRYTTMQAAMASAERLFRLLDVEPDPALAAGGRPIRTRPRGEIAFEEVSFGYQTGQPVLREVSFRVRPGERVGVVGWTGSGKSTLIRLLVRLYEPWDGRITLDGVDVREYDVRDLRRAVGVVLQDPFLFSGTVESNISLGDPRVAPARVRLAAAAVRADRFIEALPGGYAEEVRERGSNFSVGEKQLVSFARALAFDPALLVLDEATASVDAETERSIQQALAAVLRGRTSIVIAHRLATIQDSDRILVLHRGRLREQGSHRELMELGDGIYRALYTLQAAPM